MVDTYIHDGGGQMIFKRLFMYKRVQQKQCRFLLQRTGQVTVELILLLVIFVGIAGIIRGAIGDTAENLIKAPWEKGIRGMIESGNWGTRDEAKKMHPGIVDDRKVSIKGEKIQ